VGVRDTPGTSTFFFATGRNFPDGLAAGDAAAMWSFFASQDPTFPAMAVLLTNDKVMPQVTANYHIPLARPRPGEWDDTARRTLGLRAVLARHRAPVLLGNNTID
jgi:hypothetical protein